MMKIKELVRDNVCNSENDFSDVFTWTVYGQEGGDWIWSSDEQYVAICTHRGGDVRGNYGLPRFFRVGDPLAETGFVDWNVSWYCLKGADSELVEKINEECMYGYTSNPTYHLSELLGTDECEWQGGEATVETEGGTYVVAPCYYGGDVGSEVIAHIEDRGGYLFDAAIDTDAWIEAVLKAGDAEEITETVQTLADIMSGTHFEWDNSNGVTDVLEVIKTIDGHYGDGATRAIVEELESDDENGLATELHAKLVKLIDRVASTLIDESEHLDHDSIMEFTNDQGVF